MKREERRLQDLVSIGPAMLRDFELLGIHSVSQLARQNPKKLYSKLERVARQHMDICCSGCILRRYCAGKKPPASRGAMQVVVLEPQAKGPRCALG